MEKGLWKGKVRSRGVAPKPSALKPVSLRQLGQLSPSFVYRLFRLYCRVFNRPLASPSSEGFRVFLAFFGSGLWS